MKLIDKVFHKEEIGRIKAASPYLNRWVLLRFPFKLFSVYLHHFVGNDWSRDLHDHPRKFISIGIWGRYVEETPGGVFQLWKAPWIRMFSEKHIHRIKLVPSYTCWTIVIALRVTTRWGFWRKEEWIHWEEYMADAEAAGPN